MSKASPAVRSWPSLPDLATIAIQTRLITRKSRRFTAAGFLQSLLSSVATGQASLNQIAGGLKDRELRGMARQSLQQRYSSAATAITGSAIQRLLIEDSTSQVMPKSNAYAFPAHGNHHGKNLSPIQADAGQFASIYRARWAVEIQFRAWKQALNLGKALNRKSNEHHLQALVLAGMIAHQLGMKIAQRIGSIVGRARLSYEKLYDLLAVRLIQARDLAELTTFTLDPRHITRDRRTRKSPIESGILALT